LPALKRFADSIQTSRQVREVPEGNSLWMSAANFDGYWSDDLILLASLLDRRLIPGFNL
jgi:hypothetical protein